MYTAHVGEASVQFPESPVRTSAQSNEELDQSRDLFLSPEAEEEFEHNLSHRRMATGLMDAKLFNNLGETSDENEEDLQSERSKSQAEEENGLSDIEVWENDDDDSDENTLKLVADTLSYCVYHTTIASGS